MARRVLTVSTINELLDQGQTELRLAPGDIVTALAKEHAQQRGLRLVPAAPGATVPTQTPAGSPGAAPTPQPSMEPIPGRAAVRKAVIAALGHEPDGLDAIIARVMK